MVKLKLFPPSSWPVAASRRCTVLSGGCFYALSRNWFLYFCLLKLWHFFCCCQSRQRRNTRPCSLGAQQKKLPEPRVSCFTCEQIQSETGSLSVSDTKEVFTLWEGKWKSLNGAPLSCLHPRLCSRLLEEFNCAQLRHNKQRAISPPLRPRLFLSEVLK